MKATPHGKPAMQERILEATDRLFYQLGIHVAGVDTIAAEIGISKRTLYNYFPSKEALILAYLSRRLRPIEASGLPAGEQILAAFDRLEQEFARRDFHGCAFVNAVAELKEPRHAARRLALSFKEQRRAWFHDLLIRLKVKDADTLAMQLLLLVDGAIAAALVRGDPKVARTAREAARVLLAAAGVVVPPRRRARTGRNRRARPVRRS